MMGALKQTTFLEIRSHFDPFWEERGQSVSEDVEVVSISHIGESKWSARV